MQIKFIIFIISVFAILVMSPVALVNPTRLFVSKLLHVCRKQVIETETIFPKQRETHNLFNVNGHSCECSISCDIRMANYSLAFEECSLSTNFCHLRVHRVTNKHKRERTIMCQHATRAYTYLISFISTTTLGVLCIWRNLKLKFKNLLPMTTQLYTDRTSIQTQTCMTPSPGFSWGNIWKVFITAPE